MERPGVLTKPIYLLLPALSLALILWIGEASTSLGLTVPPLSTATTPLPATEPVTTTVAATATAPPTPSVTPTAIVPSPTATATETLLPPSATPTVATPTVAPPTDTVSPTEEPSVTPSPTITVVIVELPPTPTPKLSSEQEQLGTITVLIFVGFTVAIVIFAVVWMVRRMRAP